MQEKIFKCPIHGYIKIKHELILKLIHTNAFQRLRRIKQMGGADMAFPTAEHSRFSHSLGTYEVCRRLLKQLSRTTDKLSDPKDEMLALVSALLHDLGHGPFSHSFESVLNVDHEEFTVRAIKEDSEIKMLLECYYLGFSKDVIDVISKKHKNKIIVSLISSQLDVDRLDYLLRDAHFSGVPYGKIDLDKILRSVRIHDGRVVFKESGMHAIEDYLLSRYQMFWQVCAHKSSRSFDFVVMSMFDRIKDLLKSDYEFSCDMSMFKNLFCDYITIEDYLKFDDGTITTFATFLENEDDSILQDLVDRFLNRRLFKEINFKCEEEMNKEFTRLSAYGSKYYLIKDSLTKTAYDYYGCKKESDEPIFILQQDGEIVEISKVSDIVFGTMNTSKKRFSLFVRD